MATTKSKSTKSKGTSRAKAVKRSSVITALANAKHDGDTTAAGKSLRSAIRRHGAKSGSVTSKWLTTFGKSNADGNRYPDTVPVAVLREIGLSK